MECRRFNEESDRTRTHNVRVCDIGMMIVCVINSADIILVCFPCDRPIALTSSKLRHSYRGVFYGEAPPQW